MKNILILAIVLLLLGSVLFFGNPSSDEVMEGRAEGAVTAVDVTAMAFDGPALVTLHDDAGEAQVIAIPSMGLPLCAAFEAITPVDLVSIGDHVSVLGSYDEEGRIVPCEDSSHFLRVEHTVRDSTLGYEFVYPKGPDGYILLVDEEAHGSDFLSGHLLFNRHEYELFMNSTDAREGPPALHVRVYENPENLHAPVWAERNPNESNIALAFGEPQERVVSGANAIHYIADGLYATDTYIIAHAGYIYVLMGSYLDQDSKQYRDYQSMVESFTFIKTPDQV